METSTIEPGLWHLDHEMLGYDTGQTKSTGSFI